MDTVIMSLKCFNSDQGVLNLKNVMFMLVTFVNVYYEISYHKCIVSCTSLQALCKYASNFIVEVLKTFVQKYRMF